MKKIAFLLFIAGLFVISFTNTNCKRKDSGIIPISGDTQTTSTKIDSTGEDVHVTVKLGTIASQTVITGATVFLVNNQSDEDSFINHIGMDTWEPTYMKYIKKGTTGSDGICTFSKVKPISGFVPFADANYAKQYTYYVHVNWTDGQFIPHTGFYDPNQAGASNPITVSINNGSLNKGLQVSVAVQ